MTSWRPTLSYSLILKKKDEEFVFYLDITPSHAFLWSKAWLEIKGVFLQNTLMKWFGKNPDFNLIESYWTVQKRKAFLFQLQFLDKDDFLEALNKAAKSTSSSEVKVQLTIWIVDSLIVAKRLYKE